MKTAREVAEQIVARYLPKTPTYLAGDMETGKFTTVADAIAQALESRDKRIGQMRDALVAIRRYYGSSTCDEYVLEVIEQALKADDKAAE